MRRRLGSKVAKRINIKSRENFNLLRACEADVSVEPGACAPGICRIRIVARKNGRQPFVSRVFRPLMRARHENQSFLELTPQALCTCLLQQAKQQIPHSVLDCVVQFRTLRQALGGPSSHSNLTHLKHKRFTKVSAVSELLRTTLNARPSIPAPSRCQIQITSKFSHFPRSIVRYVPCARTTRGVEGGALRRSNHVNRDSGKIR